MEISIGIYYSRIFIWRRKRFVISVKLETQQIEGSIQHFNLFRNKSLGYILEQKKKLKYKGEAMKSNNIQAVKYMSILQVRMHSLPRSTKVLITIFIIMNFYLY